MEVPVSIGRESKWFLRTLVIFTIFFACLRLCHSTLLWADEDYHIAAAIDILHGKIPYRDFWYDKPPLNAAFYLLVGGHAGAALRLLDAAYILLACYLVYRIAHGWWGIKEGYVAAFLFAFFTTFYLPSAVIPFAADALMIVPHLAAVYYAQRRRPLQSGIFAGVGFLFNPKALFVLAACAAFLMAELPLLIVGFAIPLVVGLSAALVSGAWSGYREQVWQWGLLYAKNSPVTHPLLTGVSRTLNWLGFHAALAAGTVFAFSKIATNDSIKLGAWIAFSFAAVCLGTRFAPHYFLQLLPPLVVAASRGIVLGLRLHPKVTAPSIALLLLIPFIRFGPRYITLAIDESTDREPRWSDVVMDVDSQRAAAKVLALAHPGDTLFVWGYRPDLYVYTRMISDSRFWDSQPLTGVPADRHLSATDAIYSRPAAKNRMELARSHPEFIVDGLSLLNPKLAPTAYPELRPWLKSYLLVARTKLCLIYKRNHPPTRQ